MKQRADVILVERGLFASRAKAREAIEAGLVEADGAIIRKPSEMVVLAAQINASAPYPWVSRGGVKLAAALSEFAISPAGQSCLDIGSSTGGFTDVLLAKGATHVVAVDVGHGQMHERLRADSRVRVIEGQDARQLQADQLVAPPSLIVMDVSFISIKLILPHILSLAAPQSCCIALIKPQFEAGREAVRKGLVKDEADHTRVCDEISTCFADLGWYKLGLIPSPIAGGDGNREFLIAASSKSEMSLR